MTNQPDNFESLAKRRAPSLFREFYDFIRHHKKWWLVPILLALLMIGLLVFLASTPVAPFIYTLF